MRWEDSSAERRSGQAVLQPDGLGAMADNAVCYYVIGCALEAEGGEHGMESEGRSWAT